MSEIRNSNFHYLGSINNNGEIKDSTYKYIGKISADGRVYNECGDYIIQFYRNGEIRDNAYNYIGRYNSKGQVYDENYSYIGTCPYLIRFLESKKESTEKSQGLSSSQINISSNYNSLNLDESSSNVNDVDSSADSSIISFENFLFLGGLFVFGILPVAFVSTLMEEKYSPAGIVILCPIVIVALVQAIKTKEKKIKEIFKDIFIVTCIISEIIDMIYLCVILFSNPDPISIILFVIILGIIIAWICGIFTLIAYLKNKIIDHMSK